MRYFPINLILAGSTLAVACTTARLPQPRPSDRAEFCFNQMAASANSPSPAMLQRAAEMTRQRGGSHFLMSRQQKAASPALDIGYGRSPYGFGDPGRSTPGSLSGGIAFAVPHKEWCASWPENVRALKNAYDAGMILDKAK